MALIESANRLPSHETVESLDDEITQVRSQIQELTQKRRLVSNILLSSTKIQDQLNNHGYKHNDNDKDASASPSELPTDENPLASFPASSDQSSSTNETHQTNMHRLSFTVTTFPFTDPSPNNNLHGRLLGIRLDHCSRSGTFQKPFYILLRRIEDGGNEWRVHRHTIPAFVPLRRLEDELLPIRDDSEDPNASAETNNARKQDLHGFVRQIRHELICWAMRRDAIELLQEELDLLPRSNHDNDEERKDEEMEDSDSDPAPPRGRYGIQSIEATTFEARQARITWTDGTIARIKISNRGLVERAVVVGENGRIRGVENLLVDGESRIEELVGKLRVLVGETE